MKRSKAQPGSFRTGLTVVILVCWILPIFIVTSLAGFLINENYSRSLRDSANADLQNAMRQVEIRLLADIEESKSVSYDGTVRQAYRDYQQNPVEFNMYRKVTDYLSQKFSRNVNDRAVFITFLGEDLEIQPYAAAPGISKVNLLREYESSVKPAALALTRDQDSGIFFMLCNDELYMVRNLLDSNFEAYAVLVIQLERSALLESLYGMNQITLTEVSIDGVAVLMDEEAPSSAESLKYTSQVDGHTIVCTGSLLGLDLLKTVPMLRWAIAFVACMVIPLLFLMIWLAYRNVNHPIEVLMEANNRVQAGERGFQVAEHAPNAEFRQLYANFNDMSSQLESQFQRLYEEQQALQQAKIKALQSQINPHFLNNTLEIINWEARLADNDRVCSMIEALSTMLDAAISWDGRSQVTLREEMNYVEAYLYITKERLGDRLTITREIDPEMQDATIPLLLLQPIIENAVEYDLSRNGGELLLRAYRMEGKSCFEVEHDGNITDEGWQKIRDALQGGTPTSRGSVGIRNVSNRLTLLYGPHHSFDIREIRPGRVLAQIMLWQESRTTTA